VTAAGFQWFITAVILLNAVTLGLETSKPAVEAFGPWLHWGDRIALGIFVVELTLKIIAFRLRFFRDGWNLFDLAIVLVSVIPFAGNLSVLRALRILRVVRLLSVLPQLRRVVDALLEAIPGMASITAVLLLVFYVASVLATQLFGPTFPQWFGSVGKSMFSLFQIMTLESWSMGIVRPVMQQHPWAWAFFVPFIIVTSFAVLNLFIGILVSTMQARQQEERQRELQGKESAAHSERAGIAESIQQLRREMVELRERLLGGDRPEAGASADPEAPRQPPAISS